MSVAPMDQGPPTVRRFGAVNWLGIRSLIRREMHREIRFFGIAVFGPALQAALFASVFALAAGDRVVSANDLPFMEFLVPGLIFSALMLRAFESTAHSIMYDKLEADIGDILMAPMMPGELLTGMVTGAVAVALSVALSVWIVMMPFAAVIPAHPIAALTYLFLAALFFAGLGVIASILSEKWDTLSGKETFLLIPIIFLSGTFFPISAVPEGPWQDVLSHNPIFWMVDGFRWSMSGVTETDPSGGIMIAFSLTAGTLLAARQLIKSGYKLKP